jgi:hypothetical protein
MKFLHKNLGPVVFTEACEHLQKTNPDSSSVFVEHDGEVMEVSKSMVAELHINQFPNTNPRLADYFVNGWKISHYTLPPEKFIACKEEKVLRANNKEEIESLCKKY